MPGEFEVESADFIGRNTAFSIRVKEGALVVSHQLLMQEDEQSAGVLMNVAVTFSKGLIKVDFEGGDPSERFGGIYTQQRNGRYTCEEVVDPEYHPGMEAIGQAVFQGEVYPEVIRTALEAVKKLSPEQAGELTGAHIQSLRSIATYLGRSEPERS